MNEDEVLEAALSWLAQQGWQLAYCTRPIAEGAIGGVDAILIEAGPPRRFCFIDAKGQAPNPVRRATSFTNCIGALLKRIRIETGYVGNEAADRFLPVGDLSAAEVRALIAQEGVFRRSEYVLAVTSDFRNTATTVLDSSVSSLLHIKILEVSDAGVTQLDW